MRFLIWIFSLQFEAPLFVLTRSFHYHHSLSDASLVVSKFDAIAEYSKSLFLFAKYIST